MGCCGEKKVWGSYMYLHSLALGWWVVDWVGGCIVLIDVVGADWSRLWKVGLVFVIKGTLGVPARGGYLPFDLRER